MHQYWPDQHFDENSELYILLSVKFLSLVGEDKDARTQSAETWKVFKREQNLIEPKYFKIQKDLPLGPNFKS